MGLPELRDAGACASRTRLGKADGVLGRGAQWAPVCRAWGVAATRSGEV